MRRGRWKMSLLSGKSFLRLWRAQATLPDLKFYAARLFSLVLNSTHGLIFKLKKISGQGGLLAPAFGKLNFQFALIICVFAFAGCEKSVSETKPQNVKTAQATATPLVTPSIPKDGNYDGKGEVTKINSELGSIELKHEDMPGLMPAMQMEFFVKDKALLKGLAVGDKVDFVVEYKHPTEVISSIKKTQ